MERIRIQTSTADIEARCNGNVLAATLSSSVSVVTASQTWGVLDRSAEGRGVFLLTYDAKTVKDYAAASWRVGRECEIRAEAEDAICLASVERQGKPAPGAAVVVHRPGAKEPLSLVADSRGQVRFQLVGKGLCGIRAMVVEPGAGTYEGQLYELQRHYATLTFPWCEVNRQPENCWPPHMLCATSGARASRAFAERSSFSGARE